MEEWETLEACTISIQFHATFIDREVLLNKSNLLDLWILYGSTVQMAESARSLGVCVCECASYVNSTKIEL